MEISKRSRNKVGRRASQFFAITAALTVLYVLAHVFELAGLIMGEANAETLLSRLPAVFYIYALVCLCLIFRRLSKKSEFDVTMGRLLTKFGISVSIGGMLTVIGNPIVHRMVFKEGPFLDFDRSAMLLIVAGFIFTMLGNLLKDYGDIKRKLGEFL
ncbi:hypothetical protein AAG594_09680 [Citromicrobium bathyomarinum]